MLVIIFIKNIKTKIKQNLIIIQRYLTQKYSCNLLVFSKGQDLYLKKKIKSIVLIIVKKL